MSNGINEETFCKKIDLTPEIDKNQPLLCIRLLGKQKVVQDSDQMLA